MVAASADARLADRLPTGCFSMTVAYGGLADLVALSHLTFIAWLIVGAPLALRQPKLFLPHASALAATAAVNLAGMDCPLTVWEKKLDRLAGGTPYDGGFISHYLVEPLYSPGIDGTANFVILAAWMLPTAVAYTALARRRLASATSQ